MQLTGNPTTDAAMDAALVASTRQISWRVLFDWDNNGTYANAWSDLSGALESVNGTTEWTTSLPQDVAGITGFSTAEVTMVFGGTRADADTLTAFQLLSEYNPASPLYGMIRVGIRCTVDCIVTTSSGPVTVRKFTGVVHFCTPRRSDNTVSVVAWDNSSLLNQALTLPRWAVDGAIRQAHAALPYSAPSASINGFIPYITDIALNAGGVVDLVLRNNGFYVAPAPASGVNTCLLSIPFSGSHLPDVGYGFFNYSSDANPGSGISLISENPPWAPGQYGTAFAANIAYNYLYNYQTNQTVITNGPPAGGISYAIGFWVKPDGNTPSIPFGGTPGCSFELWFTPTTNASGNTCRMRLRVDHFGATNLQVDGQSGFSITASGPALTVGAWNYIAVAVTFQPTQVQYTFFSNGVQGSTTTHAGAYPTVTFGYFGQPYEGNQQLGLNNEVFLQFDLSMQSVQIWAFGGAPAAANWQMSPPAGAHTIDMALNNLSTLPDLINADAWQTLQDLVGAEFGVIYTDELGNWHFYNHVTLRGIVTSGPTRVVTLDSLAELELATAKDGVRNYLTWSATSSAQWFQPVWQAGTTGQLTLPPGPSYQVPLQNSDASYIDTDVEGIVTATSPDAILATLNSGWYAIEQDNGNAQFNPTVGAPPTTNFGGFFWEVHADPLGRFGTLSLQNVGSHTLQFSTVPSGGGAGAPSFIIAGYQIVTDAPVTGTVVNAASIHNYGFRPFALPSSAWTQYAASAIAIANAVILDTHLPLPVARSPIAVLGDPRRQLGDSLELQDPGQSGPRLLCTLTGINWSWGITAPYMDSLTVQLVAPPGGWILGDADFSILGSSTNLI